MRKIFFTLLISVALVCFAASSAVAAPLWEFDTKETVTEGVVLRRLDRFYKNTWDRVRVLYVDLENENLSLRIMTAKEGISERETTLSMAQEYGAVAAINGDFFNMTNAPTNMLGMLVQDGELHSSPSADTGLANFVLLEDNSVLMDYFTFSGTVTSPEGYTSDLFAINKVPVTTGGITMLTPAWGRMTTGALKQILMTEMVVENGAVTDIRVGMEPTEIPENGYVLVTNGDINGFLSDNFQIGDSVEFTTELLPEVENIREATGGGTVLVRDGKIVPFTHNVSGYAQRTAIGVDKTGKTLMLVTVDGRMSECEGMTQSELATLLVELGCDTALNLDGGGSTTMVARERYSTMLAVQNTLAGSMRKVSTAIGVFENAPKGTVKGIDAKLSATAVACGEPVELEYVLYDQYRNNIEGKADKVKITTDRPSRINGNTIVPLEGGAYEVTLSYGSVKEKISFASVENYVDIYMSVQSKRIAEKDSYTFALRGTDAFGNSVRIPSAQVEWSVDSEAFNVENGTVTALEAGNGNLRADFAGLTAYAAIATPEETLYNKPVDIGEAHPDYGSGNGYELYVSGSAEKETTLLKRLLNLQRKELLATAKDGAYRLGAYAGDEENVEAIQGFSEISINNNLLLTVSNAKGGIKNTDVGQWPQLIDAVQNAEENSIVILMQNSVYGLEANEKKVFDALLEDAVARGKKVYLVYEGSETDYAMENGVTYLVCGTLKNAHTKTFYTDAERFACLKLTLTLDGVKFEYLY